MGTCTFTTCTNLHKIREPIKDVITSFLFNCLSCILLIYHYHCWELRHRRNGFLTTICTGLLTNFLEESFSSLMQLGQFLHLIHIFEKILFELLNFQVNVHYIFWKQDIHICLWHRAVIISPVKKRQTFPSVFGVYMQFRE